MTQLLPEYLEWLRVCGRSSRTIEARREILTRIDDDLPQGLDLATADELRAWVYRDDWTPGTRETYYGAVRSFFVWATDPHSPQVDFDPTAMLPRPSVPRRLPRPITDSQLLVILTNAADPFLTYSTLAAYAGLRCCEIAQLDREDIDERSILIRRGKGGRPGVVPTHDAIWRQVRDKPAGPIAVDDTGHRAGANWVSIRTALYFRRKLDLPGVGLHRLRHWFGTTVYRRTKDIRTTQELLRHQSPATTAGYTLISDEERAHAVATLPTITGARQA
jgi:integrase